MWGCQAEGIRDITLVRRPKSAILARLSGILSLWARLQEVCLGRSHLLGLGSVGELRFSCSNPDSWEDLESRSPNLVPYTTIG